MIRPLRRRHLWMIALVALATGSLLVLALCARPDRPIQETLPHRLESPAR
jgi:hypothetical protein